MSRRELEALKTDSQNVVQTRLRPREHQFVMSQQESGTEEYSCMADLTELCDLRMRLDDAEVLAGEQQAKIAEMEDVLVRTRTELELENLKALLEQQRRYEKLIADE